MELSAERIPIGRIIIGLYGKVAPKTVENFYRICSNEHGLTPEGIPLSYEGTYFTTINDRMLIGGDFTHFNGLGGASIYGKPFKSENFDLKHFGPMLVSSYATEDDLNLS